MALMVIARGCQRLGLVPPFYRYTCRMVGQLLAPSDSCFLVARSWGKVLEWVPSPLTGSHQVTN